tara:strand:- start:449 stop:565 length:117 start_codon:yes stop_codon:yes gene_type:complete
MIQPVSAPGLEIQKPVEKQKPMDKFSGLFDISSDALRQ